MISKVVSGTGGGGGGAGPAGPAGPEGPEGPAGDDGATGATGTAGAAGKDGATGATGTAGAAGKDGAAGATGATGATGAAGKDGGAAAPVTQAAWYIDSTAANDLGAGTIGDPLKTDAELALRWGPGAILNIPVTVTYVNSPAGDTNYDVKILTGGSLTLLGATSLTTAVAISAVQAQVRATPTRWAITATGLGATHVGKIVEIISSGTGGNVGAYATVLKDLGAGKVLVTQFIKPTLTVATNVTPLVGDTVSVHTFPTLTVASMRIAGQTSAAAAAGPLTNCVLIDLLKLAGTSARRGAIFTEAYFYTNRVLFSRIFISGTASQETGVIAMGGGGTGDLVVGAGGRLRAFGAGFLSDVAIYQGGYARVADCHWQGATGVSACLAVDMGGVVWSDGNAFFDSVSAGGIQITGGTVLQITGIPDWGSGCSNFGLWMTSGSAYLYTTKPTVTGVGNAFYMAATAYAWSSAPIVSTAYGSMVQLNV